jgi:hypothetical protein
VADAAMAERMALWAQVGHEGSDFLVGPFLERHSEYQWMQGLLKDMKCRPWTIFPASGRQ